MFKLLRYGMFLTLGLCSCRKNCEGEGARRIQSLTADNWTWFNYPEGTKMAYENNFGERDTATFGPVYTSEESCCHNDKECYTIVTQTLNQDITWKNGLKGRTRPIRLQGRGNDPNELWLENTNDVEAASFENYMMIDTSFFDGMLYKDVYKGCCFYPPIVYHDFAFSKTAFFLKMSYVLPDNSIETWERK